MAWRDHNNKKANQVVLLRARQIFVKRAYLKINRDKNFNDYCMHKKRKNNKNKNKRIIVIAMMM